MHGGLGISGDGFDVLEGVLEVAEGVLEVAEGVLEVAEGVLEIVAVVVLGNLEGVVGVCVELSHLP